jgi:hypothetical protein
MLAHTSAISTPARSRSALASRGMLSARTGPGCSFNPHSLAPYAAIRLSKRCRPMRASSSMTARAVANGSSPSRAIAAFSALTAQCRVRRHRATCVAACQKFVKCPEALKARSRRDDAEMRLGPRAPSRPWTPADDAQLLTLLDSKMDRALIAWNLKRTVSAISKRRAILNKRRLAEPGLTAKGK